MGGTRQEDLLRLEGELYQKGLERVAGVDEAGRGCLAGPVFAAALVLPRGIRIPGVKDSKKLSPQKREELFIKIVESAVAWSVASVDVETIDKINILRASLLAMERAVSLLAISPQFLLIDGPFPIPSEIPQRAVVRGDALSHLIGGASILAKVSRDRFMREVAKSYPEFGFDRHKGYGTLDHRTALLKYGPTPLHRRSFLSGLL